MTKTIEDNFFEYVGNVLKSIDTQAIDKVKPGAFIRQTASLAYNETEFIKEFSIIGALPTANGTEKIIIKIRFQDDKILYKVDATSADTLENLIKIEEYDLLSKWNSYELQQKIAFDVTGPIMRDLLLITGAIQAREVYENNFTTDKLPSGYLTPFISTCAEGTTDAYQVKVKRIVPMDQKKAIVYRNFEAIKAALNTFKAKDPNLFINIRMNDKMRPLISIELSKNEIGGIFGDCITHYDRISVNQVELKPSVKAYYLDKIINNAVLVSPLVAVSVAVIMDSDSDAVQKKVHDVEKLVYGNSIDKAEILACLTELFVSEII